MKSKSELLDIASDMAEHMGTSGFLNELLAGMSRDELNESLEHIDRMVFENHFFSEQDEEEEGEELEDWE